MADIALSSAMFVRPMRSPWGAFPTRSHQALSTTAKIWLGQPVTLNYTGSTSVGNIVGSTADNTFYLVGIAAQTQSSLSSSSADGPTMAVWEANPNVEFRGNTFGATLGSSHIGLHKKLTWDSTLNIAKIDLSASTATDWRVVVTGLIDAVGDSGGAVSFKFLSRLTENIGSTVAVTSSSPVLAFYC